MSVAIYKVLYCSISVLLDRSSYLFLACVSIATQVLAVTTFNPRSKSFVKMKKYI